MKGEPQVLGDTELAVYESIATMQNERQDVTIERIVAQTDLDENTVRAALQRLRDLDMVEGLRLGPHDWDVWGLNP